VNLRRLGWFLTEGGSHHDFKRAPADIEALLDIASGQTEWRDVR
jgi:hypothetical protein